jgi:hypothetical protein
MPLIVEGALRLLASRRWGRGLLGLEFGLERPQAGIQSIELPLYGNQGTGPLPEPTRLTTTESRIETNRPNGIDSGKIFAAFLQRSGDLLFELAHLLLHRRLTRGGDMVRAPYLCGWRRWGWRPGLCHWDAFRYGEIRGKRTALMMIRWWNGAGVIGIVNPPGFIRPTIHLGQTRRDA